MLSPTRPLLVGGRAPRHVWLCLNLASDPSSSSASRGRGKCDVLSDNYTPVFGTDVVERRDKMGDDQRSRSDPPERIDAVGNYADCNRMSRLELVLSSTQRARAWSREARFEILFHFSPPEKLIFQWLLQHLGSILRRFAFSRTRTAKSPASTARLPRAPCAQRSIRRAQEGSTWPCRWNLHRYWKVREHAGGGRSGRAPWQGEVSPVPGDRARGSLASLLAGQHIRSVHLPSR